MMHPSTLMMKAAISSETAAPIHQTATCTVKSCLRISLCESLQSHIHKTTEVEHCVWQVK